MQVEQVDMTHAWVEKMTKPALVKTLKATLTTVDRLQDKANELEARIDSLRNELTNIEQELIDLDEGADYDEPTDDPANHVEVLPRRAESQLMPCIYGGVECDDEACDCLGLGEVFTNLYDEN